MTFARTLKATALVATLATCAFAATSAHAEGKRDLIGKLPGVQKAELDPLATNMLITAARPLVGQAQAVLEQSIAPEKREATAKLIDAEITKYMEGASPIVKASANKVGVSAYAEVLENQFTEEELKQLVAMLDSAVFKKYQAALPDIQKSLLAKITDDAKAAVNPKLSALNQSVGKILDAATGGQLSSGGAKAGGAAAPAQAGKTPAKK